MTPAVEQSVTFKATPAELYELFLDSAKHTAATEMPAKISRKVGGKWSAFGGMVLGRESGTRSESHDRADVAFRGMEKGGPRFHPHRPI